MQAPVCPEATELAARSVRLRLLFLEAVEDQLNASGDADLIEYAEEVVADDLLLSRGWRPQTVILASIAITSALGVAAAESLQIRLPVGAAIGLLCLGFLVATAIGLGSLRSEDPSSPSSLHEVRGPASPPKRADFRDLAHHGANQAKP